MNFEIPEEESGQIFDEEEKDTNNSFFKNHTPDEYYIYHIYDLIKE